MELNEPDFKKRLSMIDETGHRRFIIPAEVRGFFKTRKRWVHSILLLIFLILPWIQVGGEQAVLLHLQSRQFHFFGLHLYAHDAPKIFFVFLILTMGLALVTAWWGRVWCGWACPQTVFIESLYRQIEIWTEGSYLQRREMEQASWSLSKLRKRGLKWLLYVGVSFLISHSFLAYWTGSRELLAMMGSSPFDHGFYFVLVMSMTGLLLFNFAWFREQFCLIVCPYGKFQSVLMDSHSVTVMYDEKRGEPRRQPGSVATQKGAVGDCVACQRCVQVCPTGIDIRNGVQMECIGCTACIDACDEIMAKVKKPSGLIRYKPLTSKPVQWFRGRIVAYLALFTFGFSGLVYSLSQHEDVRVELLRAHTTPFQVRKVNDQTWVENQFLLRVENHKQETIYLSVRVSDPKIRNVLPQNPLRLDPGQKKDFPYFLEVPQELFQSGSRELEVILEDSNQKLLILRKLKAVGPYSASSSSEGSVENP